MWVLFIHQNFPGQYLHLAAALRQRGDRVVAIGGPTASGLEGVELHHYDPMPAGGVPTCHSWAADFQTKVIRAEAVATLLQRLALKDVLPEVPVLHQGDHEPPNRPPNRGRPPGGRTWIPPST